MRIPSLRRHATGQAFFTVSGRNFYCGPWGHKTSKAKYKRLVAELLTEDCPDNFAIPKNQLTITNLIDSYARYAKKYYGVGASSEYIRMKPTLKAIRELYGDSLASDFGPKAMKAVREKLATEGDRSRVYINRLTRYIVVLFKYAASEEMTSVTVYQALKTVPPLKLGRTDAHECEKVTPAKVSVVDASLLHMPPVIADMVRFQMLVGCRPGEVCSIKPRMVEKSGDVWEIQLEQHKGKWRGKGRTIYVGPKAQEILEPYLKRDDDSFCFSPQDSERKRRSDKRETPIGHGNRLGKSNTNKLTDRKIGDHYTTSSYGRAITRAAKKAGVEHWSPNQSRHYVGTKVRREHGLEASSCVLGHAKVDVTQIYAEADREKAIGIVKLSG